MVYLSFAQQAGNRKAEEGLGQRVEISGYQGEITAQLDGTFCGHQDPFSDHGVQFFYHKRVLYGAGIDHQSLDKIVFLQCCVFLIQVHSLGKNHRSAPVAPKHIPDLFHGGAAQFLKLAVGEIIGLEKLIIGVPDIFQGVWHNLGDGELIMVLHTAGGKVLQAPVGVPELDHGGCEDHVVFPHIPPLAPGILDLIVLLILSSGKLHKVKGEEHSFGPGVSGVHAGNSLSCVFFSAEFPVNDPGIGRGHKAVSVGITVPDRVVFPVRKLRFILPFVADCDDIFRKFNRAVFYNQDPGDGDGDGGAADQGLVGLQFGGYDGFCPVPAVVHALCDLLEHTVPQVDNGGFFDPAIGSQQTVVGIAVYPKAFVGPVVITV